jgi:biopolymer transport protein ExbD
MNWPWPVTAAAPVAGQRGPRHPSVVRISRRQSARRRAVRANVERLHAQKPEWGVMVTAEQDAETGLLVQVIDQVREGGVQNISFGTSSK